MNYESLAHKIRFRVKIGFPQLEPYAYPTVTGRRSLLEMNLKKVISSRDPRANLAKAVGQRIFIRHLLFF